MNFLRLIIFTNLATFKNFIITLLNISALLQHEKFTNLWHLWQSMYQPKLIMRRSSRSEEFCKKGDLRDYPKFTGKDLCSSLFFSKVTSQQCATLSKKTSVQLLPCNFWELLKNTFFKVDLWAIDSKSNVFIKELFSLTFEKS